MTLETKNLRIFPCDVEILQEAIKGHAFIAGELKITVPDNWTEFGKEALQYSLERLSENSSETGWWTYLPIYKSENKLIGSGGYKGKPTEEGGVEIGYEIAPDYRNRGLATEMTKALIENAFRDRRVKLIYAHTLGAINPSVKVLMKCGFEKIEELSDPEDGVIWKWKLQK